MSLSAKNETRLDLAGVALSLVMAAAAFVLRGGWGIFLGGMAVALFLLFASRIGIRRYEKWRRDNPPLATRPPTIKGTIFKMSCGLLWAGVMSGKLGRPRIIWDFISYVLLAAYVAAVLYYGLRRVLELAEQNRQA